MGEEGDQRQCLARGGYDNPEVLRTGLLNRNGGLSLVVLEAMKAAMDGVCEGRARRYRASSEGIQFGATEVVGLAFYNPNNPPPILLRSIAPQTLQPDCGARSYRTGRS
jgi:hypothetical protein